MKLSKVINIILSIAILVVLGWCSWLGLSAYNQHKSALNLNAQVLEDMKIAVQQIKVPSACNSDTVKSQVDQIKNKTESEIGRLQLIEEKLFDSNTVSFQYQFVILIIITLGTGALGIMYNFLMRQQVKYDASMKKQEEFVTQAQEREKNAQERGEKLLASLAPFVDNHNTGYIIATKIQFVYTLCRLYLETNGPYRNDSHRLIASYLDDIYQHLNEALEQKEGLEPRWLVIILDMLEETVRLVEDITVQVKKDGTLAPEYINRIRRTCQEVSDFLHDNDMEFENFYKNDWKDLTGKEYKRDEAWSRF